MRTDSSTIPARGRFRHFLIAVAFGLTASLATAPLHTAAADSNAATAVATATVELPNSDGHGLLAKPPPFTVAEGAAMFIEGKGACDSECVTPFGELLGIADGARGISNCRSICIRPEYSFLDLTTGEVTVHDGDPKDENLHYIGLTYQCVEYARKWWMKNLGITFGSIDSAHEIIYLSEGTDIRTKASFPLARSINGTAKRAPRRGDLVVYYPDRDIPEWRHGHVAVVVSVDEEQGVVSVAEENYDNDPWQDPKAFARQISLFGINGRYTLLDVPPDGTENAGGGRISGWIYPVVSQ